MDNPRPNEGDARVVKTIKVNHPGGGRALGVDMALAQHGPRAYTIQATSGSQQSYTRLVYAPFDFPAPGVEPADFDAFWTRVKAELAGTPPNYRVTPLPGQDGTFFKAYKVVADVSATATVTMFMAVPTTATAAGLPAIINYPAYGNRSNATFGSRPSEAAERTGAISLTVSIHEGGELAGSGGYPGDNANPSKNYFYDGIKRCLRAVDFVKQLNGPVAKFDGTDIMVWGESQGGGLSKMVAGLYPDDIDLVFTGVDAYAAHGYRPDGASGFPFWVEAGVPESAVAYYDAVYHSRRIKARKVFTSVGLIDNVSPPSSQLAELAQTNSGSIQFVLNRDEGHNNTEEYGRGYLNFARQNFTTNKPSWPYGIDEAIEPFDVTVTQTGTTLTGTYTRNGVVKTGRTKWGQVSGPGQLAFSNGSASTTSFSGSVPGVYVVSFEVSDPAGPTKEYLAKRTIAVNTSGLPVVVDTATVPTPPLTPPPASALVSTVPTCYITGDPNQIDALRNPDPQRTCREAVDVETRKRYLYDFTAGAWTLDAVVTTPDGPLRPPTSPVVSPVVPMPDVGGVGVNITWASDMLVSGPTGVDPRIAEMFSGVRVFLMGEKDFDHLGSDGKFRPKLNTPANTSTSTVTVYRTLGARRRCPSSIMPCEFLRCWLIQKARS